RVEQRREIAANQSALLLSFDMERFDANARGDIVWGCLLIEGFAFDPVGESLQYQGAIFHPGEDEPGHTCVVLEQVTLGVAGFRVKDLLEARNFQRRATADR